MRFPPLASLFALVMLAACAQVPRESVELSATVGRDLGEIHRAHKALAQRYFGMMKRDVNAFVDNEYRPFIVQHSMKGLNLLEELKNSKDPLFQMEVYVTEAIRRIEQTRAELLAPILEQEGRTIRAIDEAYLRVQNANSIVTGHLASIVRVSDAQAQLLDRVGLDELRTELPSKLAQLSDGLAELLGKARRKELQLDELESRAKELTNKLNKP